MVQVRKLVKMAVEIEEWMVVGSVALAVRCNSCIDVDAGCSVVMIATFETLVRMAAVVMEANDTCFEPALFRVQYAAYFERSARC